MLHPQVCLIVCTIDASRLDRLGVALSQQTNLPGRNIELLVVHSGSAKGTSLLPTSLAALMDSSDWSVREISCKERGLSQARNAGLASTQSEIIAWTDDDTEPAPDWLSELISPILAGEADAVAGACRLASNILKPWMTERHRKFLAEVNPIPSEVWILTGVNMAFHRRILQEVPRFEDELGAGGKIGFGEDSLFSIQILEKGYRILGAPKAIVEHHPDTSRLDRKAWKKRAMGAGQSQAHIAYHWGGHRLRSVSLHFFSAILKSGANYVRRFLGPTLQCPATEAELDAWQAVAFHRTLLGYLGTPRKGCLDTTESLSS